MKSHDTHFGLIQNLKNDLPASLVVFLVAVPLCLGIALASGAPLAAGIIAGVIGGFLVGSISGSSLGVSGPAAGLAVIVLHGIGDLGFSTFLAAIVIGGALQIIFGLVKGGIIAYFFPSSVVKGMLSGIGIIIFLKQIPHAFGYDADYEGDFSFFQTDGHNTFTELYYMLDYVTPGSIVVAAISILILIIWDKPFMKKINALKFIQGPLVVVLSGIGMCLMFTGHETLEITSRHLVKIPVIDSKETFNNFFTFPEYKAFANINVYLMGLTIAIVASLETLLCVEATDKLDPFKRITPTNRELIAQGVGNIVSGLIGGLPITQVIVRSSANIQSGGRTKGSAIYHGILIVVCVLLIPQFLNLIPLASLAAILFFVGYKLAKPSIFKEMYKKGMAQFIPFVVTILGIVFTDLLTGVGIGLVVGVFQILYNNFSTPYFFELEDHLEDAVIKLELAEEVTFLHKATIIKSLSLIHDNSNVVIDASKSRNIDPDVVEIITDFKEAAPLRDIHVSLIGFGQTNTKVQQKNQHRSFMKTFSSRSQKAT